MTTSGRMAKALATVAAQRYRNSQAKTYQAKRETHAAARLSGNLLSVNGSLHTGAIESETALVENIGRPASAAYAASGGGAVIINRGGSGGGGTGTGELVPHDLDSPLHLGLLSWGRVNKAGASLADIPTRTHSLLTGLTGDDHTQYVHISTARTISALHTFQRTGPPFAVTGGAIGQLVTGLNAEKVGGQLESVFMRKVANSNLDMNGYRITSPDGDTYHTLGRAVVGYVGYGDSAGFAHRGHAAAGKYALRQNGFGATILNAVDEQQIYHRINNADVMRMSVDGLYVINGKFIRSHDFVSGWTGGGWRIDYDASRAGLATAEVDELTVRGRMMVYELLVRQIRATNGSIFVSSTGKVKTVTGSGPYTITSETDHGFLVNDLIRAQRFTGSGVYQSNMTVTAVANTTQFTATLQAGSDPPAVGMEYVRLGNTSNTSRQGSLYLSADDTGAPFIDVIDGVNSFAAWGQTAKNKIRIGNLSGISGSGYGMVVGTNIGSATTTSVDFRSDGTARFGPLDTGKSNWYWDGSNMALRINTVPYLIANSSGVALYGSDGNARIVLNTSGDAYVAGVMTIGASGEIRQGTGTPGTNFEGLRLHRVGNVGRLSSYGGAANPNLFLDNLGLNFQQDDALIGERARALNWWSDITNLTGEPKLRITAFNGAGSISSGQIRTRGQSASFQESRLYLVADSYSGGDAAEVRLYSGGVGPSGIELLADALSTDAEILSGISATLNSGWQNLSGYAGAQYAKFGNLVIVWGVVERVSGGTGNTTILTLPAGYRPAARLDFKVDSGLGGSERVDVQNNGIVSVVSAANATGHLSLCGVIFVAA